MIKGQYNSRDSCDIILMFNKTNRAIGGENQSHLKDKQKKQIHINFKPTTKVTNFDIAKIKQVSAQFKVKPQEKNSLSCSISNLKQQIHKLRTQSIHLNYSPLGTERSTSCILQRENANSKNAKPKNDLSQIIKSQSLPKIAKTKTKNVLPRITLLQENQQQEEIMRHLQDHQIQQSIAKVSQPYPIFSVINLKRTMKNRLAKPHSLNQKSRINPSVSRWQWPGQTQQQSLCF